MDIKEKEITIMPEWEIKISKVENGFLLEYFEEVDEKRFKKVRRVITDTSDEDGHVDAFQDLLWEVVDFFGGNGSKYDQRRVKVIVEHGSGYECNKGNDCTVCGEKS